MNRPASKMHEEYDVGRDNDEYDDAQYDRRAEKQCPSRNNNTATGEEGDNTENSDDEDDPYQQITPANDRKFSTKRKTTKIVHVQLF